MLKSKLKLLSVVSIILISVILMNMTLGYINKIEQAYAQAQLEAKIIDSNGYNSAVEEYRNAVTTYCTLYSLTEYTDIILKMMSIYSDTHATDLLNSSYSHLNKLYPHQNEGISDIDYSIRTGIIQLNEWRKHIVDTYQIEPIDNNEYLLILIQAYELQDKDYISYAIDKGYSYSNTLNYCENKLLNTKKPISLIDLSFANRVDNLTLSLVTNNELMDEQQLKIVNLALDYKNYSKNGIKTRGGGCLAFTNDILSAAGLNVKRADCARCAGDYYGVSNDWSSIPIGAEIYCIASQQYGHVGIYIGDGYVVHCTTYKSSGATLLTTAANNGYVVKESLTSFISNYKAICWGFSGANSQQYPYQSGKYMKGLH